MSQKRVTIQRPKTVTPENWVNEKVEASLGPVKRLTIDVPADLHRRIKMTCVSRDRLMADVVREILEASFPRDAKS